MLQKYKLTVLSLVIVAVAAIFIVTNHDLFSGSEVEKEQVSAGESSVDHEESGEKDDQFKPAADPYRAYLDARDAGKPVVLEFYARW